MVTSGVYKITNIENGKVYIGSSKDINKRITAHIRELKKNIHDNTHLQSAWNKYGKEKFEFSILEFVPDINILLEREQFWMDKYQCYKRDFGYNMLPTAGSPDGNRLSKETRKRISESNKGRNCTAETKQKISNSQKGKVHTQEEREHTSKVIKEKWKDPEYRKMMLERHKNREKKELSQEVLQDMSNRMKELYKDDEFRGKMSKSHKNSYENNPEIKEKISKSNKKYYAEHPERKDKMSEKHSGEGNPMWGKPGTLGNAQNWEVIDPNGSVSFIKNLASFCREMGLSPSRMSSVASGKQKHPHKGWSCKKITEGDKDE